MKTAKIIDNRVEFSENNQKVGVIEYPDKSRYYLESAAENWETGVLTEDTIKTHGKYYKNKRHVL